MTAWTTEEIAARLDAAEAERVRAVPHRRRVRVCWRGHGTSGEHVRDVKRREHIAWRASRGQWGAGVYLRRDGLWGWSAYLFNGVGELEPNLRENREDRVRTASRWHTGTATTRRKAQRAALRALTSLDAQERLCRAERRKVSP